MISLNLRPISSSFLGVPNQDKINFGAKLTIPFVKSWNFTKMLDIFVFLSGLSLFFAILPLFSGFQRVFWSEFGYFFVLGAKNRIFSVILERKMLSKLAKGRVNSNL